MEPHADKQRGGPWGLANEESWVNDLHRGVRGRA
jgi:hypothetical protein